jgi:transposase-like protein
VSRHAPLPPEVVAEIRASAEPVNAIARRLSVSKQTVSKIRSGQIHADNGQARKALVRNILSRSPLETHAAIAERFGCHRETVRKIRLGLQWADVAPELERLDPAASGANCYLCCHWQQAKGGNSCSLGIPEAAIDGPIYARGCGAYLPQVQKP